MDGVDLSTEFGMVLADGYTMTPPSPKVYSVSIPGGNGSLDLTEAMLGDVAYENRSQEFTFYLINVDNFERAKSKISGFLHGRAFNYQMTMDPGYTYHGRFKISEYYHSMYSIGKIGTIRIEIDADPFKYLDEQTVVSNAVGGKIIVIPSGRKKVRPSIITESYTKVIYKNKVYRLPAGSYAIDEMLLEEGDNELYLNSFEIHNTTWGDLKNGTAPVTWGEFKTKSLFEWYKSKGFVTYTENTWSDFSAETWATLSGSSWADIQYKLVDVPSIVNVTIKYEWGDL